MAVTFDPKINNKTSFAVTEPAKADLKFGSSSSANSQDNTLKKMYSGWTNFSEFTKGIIKGILNGAITGLIIIGLDILISGSKKFHNKKITFEEIFKPSKSMSKIGKILAPVAAVFVFIENVVGAKLKTDKKLSEI